MSNFCERVRLLMRSKNLSQAELSRLSGVSEPSLCRYLRGDIEPRIDIVKNIAIALGVSESYLLGNTSNCEQVNPIIEIKRIVARNRNILSKQDKADIIAILYGEDDDEWD